MGFWEGIPNGRGSREAWAVPGNSSLVRRVICLKRIGRVRVRLGLGFELGLGLGLDLGLGLASNFGICTTTFRTNDPSDK